MLDPISTAAERGSLYPGQKHSPYYVVVPPYIRTSAGIRAMHLLAHWLNTAGYQAYVHVVNGLPAWYGIGTNNDLLTPPLTQDIVFTHYQSGRTPITLCSEAFSGTLRNAPFTVRWYGHYPGALAPDAIEACDMRFGYSSRLAAAIGAPDNVLLLPVIDTTTFSPEPRQQRRGSCFYASKFQTVFGGQVFGLPPDCVEITRDLRGSQLPHEIANLFRACEYFYCFEETALAVEAALCGCPVILMKNRYFHDPFGVDDFGWDGFAWGDDPAEVDRARRTVHKVADNYRAVVNRFFDQLDQFIRKTQQAAQGVPYAQPIFLPGALEALASDMTPIRAATKLAELDHQLVMMKASTSWKLTAPLRTVVTVCRALLKPGRKDETPIVTERAPLERPVEERFDAADFRRSGNSRYRPAGNPFPDNDDIGAQEI